MPAIAELTPRCRHGVQRQTESLITRHVDVNVESGVIQQTQAADQILLRHRWLATSGRITRKRLEKRTRRDLVASVQKQLQRIGADVLAAVLRLPAPHLGDALGEL